MFKLSEYVVGDNEMVHYPEVHGAHFVARCAARRMRVDDTYPEKRWSQSELVNADYLKVTCALCIAEGPSIARMRT